jgi:hypothetical protein
MSSAILGGGSTFSPANSRVGGDKEKPFSSSSMGGEAPAVLDTCLNSVNRRLLAAAQRHDATREHGQFAL